MEITEIMDLVSIEASLVRHLLVSIAVWLLVILAIVLDLWDRVYTQKTLHKNVRSDKMRVTFNKIAEYWRILLIALIIDTIGALFPFYILPYITIFLGVMLVIVEAKSMLEHARERKSDLIELGELSKAVVACDNPKDARELISKIIEYMDEDKKKGDK